jgi:hypothetical protein
MLALALVLRRDCSPDLGELPVGPLLRFVK